MLNNLSFETPAETGTLRSGISTGTVISSSGTVRAPRLTPESIAALRELQGSLEEKFVPGEDALQWHFRVGKELGALAADIDDAEKTKQNSATLERLLATVPAGVRDSATNCLKEIIDGLKTLSPDLEQRQTLLEKINVLPRMRVW